MRIAALDATIFHSGLKYIRSDSVFFSPESQKSEWTLNAVKMLECNACALSKCVF